MSEQQAWGEDRIYFHDRKGQLRAVPASWTSLAAPDPFVIIAAGRSLHRVSDLLELAALIAQLGKRV
jgi:hypothetical protein